MDSKGSKPGSSKTQENPESIYSKITAEFSNVCQYKHDDVIKECLKLRFKDTKTKITEEAVELMKEIAKVMVVESAIRAANQAKTQNNSLVSLNDVETMILQLMLDFP